MSWKNIFWYRLDLRLLDNPALLAAADHGAEVVPVFIYDPESEGRWAPGAASRWWLHHSLAALERSLARHGSRLIIRKGKTRDVLLSLVQETGAAAVYWNRRYDPLGRIIDAKVESDLQRNGVNAVNFNGLLLHEPELVRTGEGRPYKVFTPFWRHFTSAIRVEPPAGIPEKMKYPAEEIESLTLAELHLEPEIDWAGGLNAAWVPGEAGAQASLRAFLHEPLSFYGTGRDRLDANGVSMLSPHLHFGEISPRQVWHAVSSTPVEPSHEKDVGIYLKELGWREFAHHILFNFPDTSDEPLREQFQSFDWRDDPVLLKKWQRGRTGYPVVDAAMRQLWHIGWMHNRARMIVASFLSKDLLISWYNGAQWFWDTLVDADLANNSLGWQWAAGCGADAAPFFRIFNPVLQGEKFDPNGRYVRHWVPELSRLPDKWIHKPWLAPNDVLRAAGVELGKTYPFPIIDHGFARKRALTVYRGEGP